MIPTWIIEKNAYDDANPEKVAKAAREQGMDVVEVAYVPFGGGWRDNEDREKPPLTPNPGDCAIFYGSINAVRWLQNRVNYHPFTWCDFNALRCQKYYTALGEYLLQEEYAFLPLGEIYRRKDWVFAKFAPLAGEASVFIRPDDNTKSFCGAIVHYDRWNDWYRAALFPHNDPAIMAVVSAPVSILQEWRLVVVDGKVIAGSQYRENGMVKIAPDYNQEAAKWLEEVLAKAGYAPHRVFIGDVAWNGLEYRIVEVGALNTCGLYDCDVDKIVSATSKVAEEEWAEVQ